MKYYNLTTPQKNIWNLQKYYGDTAIGNQCGAIFYKEKLDNNLLKRAIYKVIECQSGLRLHFVEKEEPVQYISKELEDIPVMSFDTMDKFDDFAENFARNPIGLNDEAMYRFVVFQVGDNSGILAVLSHLISDAWTFSLIAGQVDGIYHNLAEGMDYDIWQADYTEYVQTEKDYLISERYKKDKSFWKNKYTAQPEKSIIKMLPAKSDSIEAKRFTKCLSEKLENKINKYCSNNQVTQAVLFETALITYLSRINAENNTITIGIPVLNRNNTKEKKIAGMFISTMPLTVQVKENMTITELEQQIGKGHMEIFRHQKYPYSDILKYLREKQNFSGNLYDVMISYQNARTDTETETKWYFNGYSEVPFVVHIDNRDGKSTHTINVDYQTAVFKDEREVEYIVRRLEYILAQIVNEASTDIKGVDIIPQEEMKLVVEQFNDTYVEYPREKCIHELFIDQAKKTPDKIALVFEDEKFTYKQLDEMSNSLAHYLREKGVKRNDIVPIIARRSWHVIVAMLGIMKAGGTYLPIADNYPEQRIREIINETKCRVILKYHINTNIENRLQINLDSFDYKFKIQSLQNINDIDDSSYVIYTSGSTGKPKGITQTHRCLYNLLLWQNENLNPENKNILADTIISFDVSVQEILYCLIGGGCLHFTSEKVKENTDLFLEYIIENDIKIIFTTPSYFSVVYSMDNERVLESVSDIIFAGEKLILESEFIRKAYKNNINIWNMDQRKLML